MATENVCTTARFAYIAQGQLQDARGTHHGIANRVLSLAHTPYEGTGTVLTHHFCNPKHLLFFNATSLFNIGRCPFGENFFFDFFHAEDAVIDVSGVFPVVFKDVIKHAKQEGDIRARTDAHILVRFGCSAGEPWINHNHLGPSFLGMQHVQHAHRVRFCGV